MVSAERYGEKLSQLSVKSPPDGAAMSVLDSTNSGADSPQSSELLHRPISKHRLAVNVAFVNGAEIAAVVGHRPVIPKHKEAVGRNYDFAVRPSVRIIGRNVIFINRRTVYVNLAVRNVDTVAG